MRNRKSRTPFAVHRLIDGEPAVALVRYDGDPDVFAALAADWLRLEDIHRPVKPPQPRLYRCNPDPTGEFSWTLGTPAQPGPGTFVGALIELAEWPADVCIDKWTGQQEAAHPWSDWEDRSGVYHPPWLGAVARFRICRNCNRYDAVRFSELESAGDGFAAVAA